MESTNENENENKNEEVVNDVVIADVVVEVDAEVVAEVVKVPAQKKTIAKQKPVRGPHTITENNRDVLDVNQIVVKNIFRKKSLTIHHIQRVLNELGYTSVNVDPDGFYGDGTLDAVRSYQAQTKNDVTGVLTKEQLTVLFEHDDSAVVPE